MPSHQLLFYPLFWAILLLRQSKDWNETTSNKMNSLWEILSEIPQATYFGKSGGYFWFRVPADLKNKKQFHLSELVEVKIIAETVLTIYLCVWLRVKTQKCTLDLLF